MILPAYKAAFGGQLKNKPWHRQGFPYWLALGFTQGFLFSRRRHDDVVIPAKPTMSMAEWFMLLILPF